jgi:hypothetical protein
MHRIVPCIAVVFTAGIAIQQGLEVADALFAWRVYTSRKKVVLKVAALILGFYVVYLVGLRPLDLLLATPLAAWWNYVTGTLLIGAATEVSNALIKFVVYVKEARKAAAAQSAGAAGTLNLSDIGRK